MIYTDHACRGPGLLQLTWRELKMVKSHAKTVELALTVRMPNTHVSPRRGRRTSVAANRALHNIIIIILLSLSEPTYG